MIERLDLDWTPCLFNKALEGLLKKARGVYVIWEAENRTTLYVGKGNLWERLGNHLSDKDKPLSIASREAVLVFYAEVPEDKQAGVENFLIQQLEPLHGQIKVNLPDFPVKI